MSTKVYQDGVLREHWNDATRTYTAWNAQGVQSSTRPYTTEENATADAITASDTAESNRRTVEVALSNAMTLMQGIIDQTNADIRTDPSQEIKDLARVMKGVIRILLRKFDGTA